MAPAKKKTAKRRTAKKAVKRATKRTTTRKKAAPKKKAAKRRPAKRTAKKRTAKKAAPKKKAPKRKAASKRKPSAAFMRPMQASSALQEIVGDKPLPRTEITKRLWDYIKRNKLQDPVNRRMINADAKLRPIFGAKSKVSMFEMTKLVSKHLK